MGEDLFGLPCFYRKGLVLVRQAIPVLPDGLRAKAAGLASAFVPTFSQNLHVASWNRIRPSKDASCRNLLLFHTYNTPARVMGLGILVLGVHIVLQVLIEFIFSDFVLELETQVMHVRDIIAKGFVWPLLAFH